MAKKGNLFFLIQSLTKSEKRHFKIYCFNKKVHQNYLQLFEALDKQPIFDEAAIRKKFKEQAFTRQLHVTKNYLYRLILKSLRNYHTAISKDAEIKDLLRNVEILFYKELYDLCYYEIQKVENLALAYENHVGLVQVYRWKRKMQLAKRGSRNPQLLNEAIEKEKEAIDNLAEVNAFWWETANTFTPFRENNNSTLPDNFIHLQKASSLQSNILFHHLKYTRYFISGQSEKALGYLQQLIELLEAHPHRIKDDPAPYITTLNNKLGYFTQIGQYDLAMQTLEKVKQIPRRFQLKEHDIPFIQLWLRAYNIELEIYRDTRNFEKGIVLIKEIEQFLEKHNKIIPKSYFLMYWYQFANIYFMNKQYGESLKWVNQITSHRFDGLRTDLESYTRLLNLILHFELDNIIVLRYAVESCRRFLKKKKTIEPFEKIILKFFSKISNSLKVTILNYLIS